MLRKSIPFFNYQAMYAAHAEEYSRAMQDVLRRGAFILQKDLEEFEQSLARYLGVKFAFGVANCTDGLMIALRAAGLQAGDEVILPSHTFIATAAAVHHAGGVPVPVDCREDHLVDPAAMERAITSKTRFLMPVQLNGRTCQMDTIQAMAERHRLTIVEDAAQSLGSRFRGQYAGTFGAAAAFSFYPAKILGCFGDGGAVVTNDPRIAEEIWLLRDHGRDRASRVVRWGYNSRLDNLQAAVLSCQFARYDSTLARRRQIAAMYDALLRSISALRLPAAPDSSPDHFDVFQNYEIEAERRDELRAHLKELGVGTLVQWGGTPVHQFQELGFAQRLPKTDTLFTRCLLLPMNAFLADDEVAYIGECIKGFYGTTR